MVSLAKKAIVCNNGIGKGLALLKQVKRKSWGLILKDYENLDNMGYSAQQND